MYAVGNYTPYQFVFPSDMAEVDIKMVKALSEAFALNRAQRKDLCWITCYSAPQLSTNTEHRIHLSVEVITLS